jgi:hypothetical protein
MVVRSMGVLSSIRHAPAQLAATLRRNGTRSVPAAVLEDAELIHLGGGEMLPCPGVESMPLAPIARSLGLGSASLALPAAKVHVLRDASICPGARLVKDRDGRVVSESLTADMVGRVPLGEDTHGRRPLELAGNVAIYRSPWRPHYHTLIDHLPRAALLAQAAMHRFGHITLVHDGPLDPIEELLLPHLLVGGRLELKEVEPDRSVHAERVLLPGYVTRPGSGAIPSWYRRWVDRTAASLGPPDPAEPPLPRRIFVDRVTGPRRVTNREALDRVLNRHGVQSLDLTKLSPEQEVRLFRDAELVVGVSGSGLANAVFSRSAHLVELVPGPELLPNFFYLATTKGLPYDYVLAPPDGQRLSAERRLRHDVRVDVDALDRLLERFDVS